jgi:hypothetical protein
MVIPASECIRLTRWLVTSYHNLSEGEKMRYRKTTLTIAGSLLEHVKKQGAVKC